MTKMRNIVVPAGDTFPQPDEPAPRPEWVPIADLVLDDDYQRPLSRHNWTAIRKIAAAFSWSKFSAVLCAPLPRGKLAIVDGQHRCHAAALCGFATVPALIVPMSRAEQAAAFAGVNGDTIRMTSWNLVKAAIVAGDDWAVRAARAVDDAGCRLMTYNPGLSKRAGDITSIALIRRWIERGDDALITKALKVLRATDCDNVDLYHGTVIRAWIEVVDAHRHLTDDDLASFLGEVDLISLLDDVDAIRKRPEHATTPRYDLYCRSISVLLKRQLAERAA